MGEEMYGLELTLSCGNELGSLKVDSFSRFGRFCDCSSANRTIKSAEEGHLDVGIPRDVFGPAAIRAPLFTSRAGGCDKYTHQTQNFEVKIK